MVSYVPFSTPQSVNISFQAQTPTLSAKQTKNANEWNCFEIFKQEFSKNTHQVSVGTGIQA